MTAARWVYSDHPAVEEALTRLRAKHPSSFRPALAATRALLLRLGDPHLRLPPVFHAAGTNGKGSTLAFLEAFFRAAGKTAHKYTSPHLLRFEERIVLAGAPIAPQPLLDCLRAAASAASDENSFFDIITAAAFLAFAAHPADAVLLETGMGGLFDPTNAVTSAGGLVAVLSRISSDHVAVLGPTLPDIAHNKAGIIKPGCAAVTAPQPGAGVLSTLRAAATACDAPILVGGEGWRTETTANGFLYASARGMRRLPQPALPGLHQIENAGLAIAALEVSAFSGLVTDAVLAEGLRRAAWPGRLQRLRPRALADLLADGWELWLDGAHNDSSAAALAAALDDMTPSRPVHLLTAIKDVHNMEAVFSALLPRVATVTAIDTADFGAPMVPAATLAAALQPRAAVPVRVAPDLSAAAQALRVAFPAPARILVTGSLYLVGRALHDWPEEQR